MGLNPARKAQIDAALQDALGRLLELEVSTDEIQQLLVSVIVAVALADQMPAEYDERLVENVAGLMRSLLKQRGRAEAEAWRLFRERRH